MSKKDIVIGLVVGFLIGLFVIPVIKNVGLFQQIPSPYAWLLLGLPILCALGIVVASLIARLVPVIWQVAKFGLVGVLNTAVDFGILNVLIFATGFDKGLELAILNVGSFTVALTNSYFWNKWWVFGGQGAAKTRMEFVQFIVISVIAAAVSSTIVGGMTGYIAPPGGLSSEQWANIAKVFAVIFSFVWNFLGYKFIVFRRAVPETVA